MGIASLHPSYVLLRSARCACVQIRIAEAWSADPASPGMSSQLRRSCSL